LIDSRPESPGAPSEAGAVCPPEVAAQAAEQDVKQLEAAVGPDSTAATAAATPWSVDDIIQSESATDHHVAAAGAAVRPAPAERPAPSPTARCRRRRRAGQGRHGQDHHVDAVNGDGRSQYSSNG